MLRVAIAYHWVMKVCSIDSYNHTSEIDQESRYFGDSGAAAPVESFVCGCASVASVDCARRLATVV